MSSVRAVGAHFHVGGHLGSSSGLGALQSKVDIRYCMYLRGYLSYLPVPCFHSGQYTLEVVVHVHSDVASHHEGSRAGQRGNSPPRMGIRKPEAPSGSARIGAAAASSQLVWLHRLFHSVREN